MEIEHNEVVSDKEESVNGDNEAADEITEDGSESKPVTWKDLVNNL